MGVLKMSFILNILVGAYVQLFLTACRLTQEDCSQEIRDIFVSALRSDCPSPNRLQITRKIGEISK